MPKTRLNVVVSSTVLDLPEHRPEIRNACLEQEMYPLMMENLPASDAEAISTSLKLVDEADIYLGVFAHRYGFVPKKGNRKRISITEMEYNRALERDIPRLIFLMDKLHPITIESVEMGAGAVKLAALKERLQSDNHVKLFKSPQDLRAYALTGLSDLQKRYLLATSRTANANIFVAHSKYDWDDFVSPLVERLRAVGFAVWADGDQTNEDQLNQVLKLSGWLVLCVSPSAVKSKRVNMQIKYFIENGKQIILLICRKAKLSLGLGTVPTFSYSEIEGIIKLVKSLQEQSPFAKYEL